MKVIELNNENFDKETKTYLPVLIDFNAEWCGPCRMMEPVLKDVAKEYKGIYKVCSLNVDENPDIAARFKVESIPTLIIMKDGQTVEASVGYQPIDAVRKLMDKYIG